jgi:hypothetical protein
MHNKVWVIEAHDGRTLINMPWRCAFDQAELGKRPDYFWSSGELSPDTEACQSRWEALELAMTVSPLMPEEEAALRASYPGLPQRAYVPTSPMVAVWVHERRLLELQEQRAAVVAEQAAIRQTSRGVRAVRSGPTVVRNDQPVVEQGQPEEVAPEHGERKLLL